MVLTHQEQQVEQVDLAAAVAALAVHLVQAALVAQEYFTFSTREQL
jgi:hypothetical protein